METINAKAYPFVTNNFNCTTHQLLNLLFSQLGNSFIGETIQKIEGKNIRDKARSQKGSP